jgi:hypothetical protein
VCVNGVKLYFFQAATSLAHDRTDVGDQDLHETGMFVFPASVAHSQLLVGGGRGQVGGKTYWTQVNITPAVQIFKYWHEEKRFYFPHMKYEGSIEFVRSKKNFLLIFTFMDFLWLKT